MQFKSVDNAPRGPCIFVHNPVNEVLVASSGCGVLLKCSATNQLYFLFSAATCSLQDVLQDVLQENVSKSMVCGQSDVLYPSVGSGRFSFL